MNEDRARPDLSQVLLDVRKAYRLVAAFQERVVTYVRIIRDRLGFISYGGEFIFTPRTMGKLLTDLTITYGGLEYLPLFGACYLFLRLSRKGEEYPSSEWGNYQCRGDLMLVIQVVPDWEVFDERTPSATESPEKSESYLSIWLLYNEVDHLRDRRNWYEQIFKKIDEDEWGHERQVIESRSVPHIRIYHEGWRLEDLPDEEALYRRIDAFATAVKDNMRVDLTLQPPG